jgi:cytochrome c
MRFAWAFLVIPLAAASAARATDGDAKRGAQLYRACAACHSLEPGVNLSGPSLAALWDKPAGKNASFARYSKGLKSADFAWNAQTLFAWVSDPQVMVPGTYMSFRGFENDQQRADVVAFLKIATTPGGDKRVVERGLASAALVHGPQFRSLAAAPDKATVTAIRHCGDSYFITTADGTTTPFWEANVRLKLDTGAATRPAPGKPVVIGAGMMGDRVSVFFSSVEEIGRFVEEKCSTDSRNR